MNKELGIPNYDSDELLAIVAAFGEHPKFEAAMDTIQKEAANLPYVASDKTKVAIPLLELPSDVESTLLHEIRLYFTKIHGGPRKLSMLEHIGMQEYKQTPAMEAKRAQWYPPIVVHKVRRALMQIGRLKNAAQREVEARARLDQVAENVAPGISTTNSDDDDDEAEDDHDDDYYYDDDNENDTAPTAQNISPDEATRRAEELEAKLAEIEADGNPEVTIDPNTEPRWRELLKAVIGSEGVFKYEAAVMAAHGFMNRIGPDGQLVWITVEAKYNMLDGKIDYEPCRKALHKFAEEHNYFDLQEEHLVELKRILKLESGTEGQWMDLASAIAVILFDYRDGSNVRHAEKSTQEKDGVHACHASWLQVAKRGFTTKKGQQILDSLGLRFKFTNLVNAAGQALIHLPGVVEEIVTVVLYLLKSQYSYGNKLYIRDLYEFLFKMKLMANPYGVCDFRIGRWEMIKYFWTNVPPRDETKLVSRLPLIKDVQRESLINPFKRPVRDLSIPDGSPCSVADVGDPEFEYEVLTLEEEGARLERELENDPSGEVTNLWKLKIEAYNCVAAKMAAILSDQATTGSMQTDSTST